MKKRYWIPLLVVAILVAVRLALPFWVENYVNRTLEDIEGYTGSVEDVDLNLYRGAYEVDSLVIDKIEADNPVPFLIIPKTDLSVEWGALLDGEIVGEVELLQPEINFMSTGKDEGTFGEDADWVEPVKELMPIQINRFAITEGTIHYRDYYSDPQLDIPLHNFNLEILNISNVEEESDTLPTGITLNATSIGGGILNMEGQANLLQAIPDFDLTLEFEEVNLPDLNNFLEAYARVDAESGIFNLYTELIINDGIVEGYVKPIITDLNVVDLEEGSALEVVWETIVGAVTEIFENQPRDQFATQVPLEGDLNDLEAGVFPAIWNIFRNAFVEAFSKQPIDEVNLENDEE